MKHLKRFNETASYDYLQKVRSSGDMSEIIPIIEEYIIDEFDNRIVITDIGISILSTTLQAMREGRKNISEKDYNYLCDNSFMIMLEENLDSDDWHDRPDIYWIEPKIWQVIKNANHNLKNFGYQIIYNDYGMPYEYELIICDKDYRLE